MNDTVERFSNRVANYVRFRPGYPPEVLDLFRDEMEITSRSVIADIGSGTGLSSRLFLENGNTVYGIEPNAAMRAAAEEQLADFANFISVDGTSSETTLANSTVDFVVAAQAFHWFDAEKTRREFLRILRPGGHIVLMWNERRLDATPFLVDYEAFLLKYATDYTKVRHENIDKFRLDAFFPKDYRKATFDNLQDLDFEGLKGRMLSASYMPSESDRVFATMVDELQNLFAKHAESGRIKVFYDTNVYYSPT